MPMTYIVTLQMDDASQAFFEGMRRKHFPPERNQIGAHLTLFHTLPETGEVAEALRWIGDHHSVFAMEVTGLRSLGRGVAYTLRSVELAARHAELAEVFRDHLTPQDKQKFSPHVVVQNKVTGEAARKLLEELQGDFKPFTVWGIGFELWKYLGGPWELVERFGFVSEQRCAPLITMVL